MLAVRILILLAVDSWYRDNGELPYLQPLKEWQLKPEFLVAFHPELAAN
ncbi:MAG: hypothetical protein KJP11_01015 [Gammaproteobacteria bacterium]|nr:hypothetical protein [Gammaproteobacteria bacterium]